MPEEKILQSFNSKIQGITFSLDKNIDPCQILQLYDHVSWLDGNETEETIKKMFFNSEHCVLLLFKKKVIFFFIQNPLKMGN